MRSPPCQKNRVAAKPSAMRRGTQGSSETTQAHQMPSPSQGLTAQPTGLATSRPREEHDVRIDTSENTYAGDWRDANPSPKKSRPARNAKPGSRTTSNQGTPNQFDRQSARRSKARKKSSVSVTSAAITRRMQSRARQPPPLITRQNTHEIYWRSHFPFLSRCTVTDKSSIGVRSEPQMKTAMNEVAGSERANTLRETKKCPVYWGYVVGLWHYHRMPQYPYITWDLCSASWVVT
jgi:hypothetical protein